MKDALDWATIVAGSLSAIFWLLSALVELPKAMAPATWDQAGQLIGITKKGKLVDLYPIIVRQARLNAIAATFAAIAAACQVAIKIAGL